MGLVDYSDSESDNEEVAPVPTVPAPATTSSGAKKPFQKVVDRAKPGKILVNLPQTSGAVDNHATEKDEPPSKRPKTGGGGGAFKGFNSFLPPPKNVGKPAAANSSSSKKIAPPPGVNLKTSATAGFSRDTSGEGEENSQDSSLASSERKSQSNPQQPQPIIPSEQKPVDEVKITGKPLMFKPLSVSRKPAGRKKIPGPPKPPAPNPPSQPTTTGTGIAPDDKTPIPATQPATEERGPPKKKKKMSLFGISDDTSSENTTAEAASSSGAYEPMFEDPVATQQAFAQYDAQYGSGFGGDTATQETTAATGEQVNPDSLDAVAASMNLSAAERRELFGRGGPATAGAGSASVPKLVNFSADDEWASNEALRASGQLQPAFNPVKAIAPGKHSLTQLVRQVHSQKDALEESFAKNRSTKNESGARYGWR